MVSGGQDSIALLEILCSDLLGGLRPGHVSVLHVNHHLRADESDADEALVVAHCRRLGVGLSVAHRPVEKAGGNVQARAREERRQAAVETACLQGCELIALGHTADDQVENLLYRMGRYGGMAALRGMLPAEPPWVRPLLGARRDETARFCREKGLAFAVDIGNSYPGYARTGIRQRVVPEWELALPGAVEAAARTAEVAAEVERFLQEAINASGLDVSAAHMQVPRLLAMSAALRRLVLHSWLQEQGLTVSRAAVLAVEGLLAVPGSAGRDLEGGWRVEREYDLLRLSRINAEPGVYGGGRGAAAGRPLSVSGAASVELRIPGRAEWEGAVVEATRVEHFFAPDTRREAYVDAKSVAGPLRVRGPLPGDRIRLLGAPGSRKLQDVLVDLRVPAAVRPRLPLVVAEEEIVWVCGFAVAERGRITPETVEIVRLSLVEANS